MTKSILGDFAFYGFVLTATQIVTNYTDDNPVPLSELFTLRLIIIICVAVAITTGILHLFRRSSYYKSQIEKEQ
ncbi:MAG: hypothetical protein ACSHWW_06525 [Nonlabens sp.]|uniref:hypothetical protein n=1 Tax=Nonlabens sp. TaxID=1888209 RepID=UPI003EF31666